MAYTLQAFIGDLPDFEQNALSGMKVIPLDREKALIPLTDDLREVHEVSFLSLLEDGSGEMPLSIESIAKLFKGPVAYVEAEFFGGDGTQASAVWKERGLVFGPLASPRAINEALRLLSVEKGEHYDEFEALRLGKYRDTNDWIGLPKLS